MDCALSGMPTIAISCEKRDGGGPGNREREQLAGAKAEAEGERKQEQSRKADRQHVSWLYVLEVDGRVETEAGQRS